MDWSTVAASGLGGFFALVGGFGGIWYQRRVDREERRREAAEADFRQSIDGLLNAAERVVAIATSAGAVRASGTVTRSSPGNQYFSIDKVNEIGIECLRLVKMANIIQRADITEIVNRVTDPIDSVFGDNVSQSDRLKALKTMNVAYADLLEAASKLRMETFEETKKKAI